MSEEKIVYKLKKEPLRSERREKEQRQKVIIITTVLCVCFLCIGFLSAIVLGELQSGKPKVTGNGAKWDEIQDYMNGIWLYGNEYEDLSKTLEDKAFYGMTSFEEDPYTSYMSVDEYEQFSSNINMNFVGIGITYSSYDGVATILRVYKDSPADLAGLEAGDIIKKIDGQDVTGMDSDAIRELALGEEGTLVKVTVERDGVSHDFDVIRGSIDTTAYAEVDGDTVVLKLDSFGINTYNECVHYLDAYQDYSKLIIDLRGNTGGYQTSVQEVAGLFLGKNEVVMRQIFKDGHEQEYKTMGSVYYDNFKEIVVLINGETASAAEVLAMALKEQHPNVTLVGTTSFGKGVVQSSVVLSDGSVLKLTTSKWLSPEGVWINEEGIKPDHEVFLDDILYEMYVMMEEGETYAYDSVSVYNRIAQEGLSFLGYDIKRNDGYFDESFERALRDFQAEKGFEVTGILDTKSYETIISNVLRNWAMDPLKDHQMIYAKELLES